MADIFFFAHSSTLGLLASSLGRRLGPEDRLIVVALRNYDASRIVGQKIYAPSQFYTDERIYVPFFRDALAKSPDCKFVVPQIYSPAFRFIFMKLGPKRVNFAEEGVYFYTRRGYRDPRSHWKHSARKFIKLLLNAPHVGFTASLTVSKVIFEDAVFGAPYLPARDALNPTLYSVLPCSKGVFLGGVLFENNVSKNSPAATFAFFPNYSEENLFSAKVFFERGRNFFTGSEVLFTEHPSIILPTFEKLIPGHIKKTRISSDDLFDLVKSRPKSVIFSWSESVTLYLSWLKESGFDFSLLHLRPYTSDMQGALRRIREECGVDLEKNIALHDKQ